MFLILHLFVIICQLKWLVLACPNNCDCREYKVSCQCDQFGEGQLVMDTFGSMEFVKKVTVFGCEKVLIKSFTFQNMIVNETLEFKSITQLYLEPNAFAKMKQYPKQMKFWNVNIDLIPRHAFKDVSKVSQFIFRQLTIKKIDAQAFSGVRDIGYLYFYSVHISEIETNAFDAMRHIDHVTFNHKIRIGMTHAAIFRELDANKIDFEDTIFDEFHYLTLANIRSVRHMKLKNVTVHRCVNDALGRVDKDTSVVNTILIEDSTFKEITLDSFSNAKHVHITNSHIHVIEKSHYPLKNVNTFRISATSIGLIKRHSCRFEKVLNFILSNVVVSKIEKRAFEHRSKDTKIHFESTIFNQLDSSEESFALIQAREIQFTNINFTTTISGEMFFECKLQFLTFEGCKIDLQRAAFNRLHTSHLRIRNNRIIALNASAFFNLKAKTIEVTDNRIEYLDTFAFSGIQSQRTIFKNNKLNCNCATSYADLGRLEEWNRRVDFAPTGMFDFSNNECMTFDNQQERVGRYVKKRCSMSKSAKQVNQSIYTGSFITRCSQISFVSTCRCYNAGKLRITREFIQKLQNYTSFLVLIDCDVITIPIGAFSGSKLSQLVIQDSHLSLEKNAFAGMKNLKYLKVKNVTIQSLPSYGLSLPDSKMDVVYLQKLTTNSIPSKTFSQSNIREIVMEGLTAKVIHENATLGAKINKVTINDSRISLIERGSFNQAGIEQLTLSGNVISDLSPNVLPTSKVQLGKIVLQDNYFACHCSAEAIMELVGVLEVKGKNRCSGPGPLKNVEIIEAMQNNYRTHILAAERSQCLLNSGKIVSIPSLMLSIFLYQLFLFN